MKYFYTLVLLSTLFLGSCEKASIDGDEKKLDPIDSLTSSITITGVENHDTLRNEVSAIIKAKTNLGLEKVEILLNNSIIATATTEDLTLKWNSLTVPDGTYTLKAVVYTGDKRKFERSKEVVIDNALLNLDFPQNLSIGLTDIIITDLNGKILNNVKSPFSGQTKIYSKIYCPEKTINVINVFQWGGIQAIKCDLNIKKGTTWQVKDIPANGFMTPIKVKLNNIPAFDNINFSTGAFGGGLVSWISDTTMAFNTEYYYRETKKLFVQLEQSNKAHYDFFDIPANAKSINADVSNLKNESVSKNTRVNGVNGEFWISAKLDNTVPDFYRISQRKFNTKDVQYFYPDIKAEDYTSHISFLTNGWAYNYLYKSLLPETIEPMGVIADMRNNNLNSINCSVTGEFDYFTMAYYSVKADGLSYFGVTSTKPIKEYKLPDLGSIVSINTADFGSLEFRYLYIYDLGNFNSKLIPFDSQYSLLENATTPVKIAQKYNPEYGPNILGTKKPASKKVF